MTNKIISNRLPIIFAVIGLLLLGGTAYYLFAKNPETQDNVTQAANINADAAIAAAGMDRKDRAATEAIIRAYILEHPEIIPEAITILQQREAASRLSAAGDQLRTPFPGAEAGNPKGDVTVVEFTDYNCGFCRSSVVDVEKLIGGDKNIRLIYREVPILAPTSRDAALWALAAAKQGKHGAFHKAMFSGDRPGAESIRVAAKAAGMNLEAAQSFVASKEAQAEVEHNLAMMQQLGVSGTPTFIIGDQVIEGALGHDTLKAAVAKARKAG